MLNKSVLIIFSLWISLFGSAAHSGITSSKLNCFGYSEKSDHTRQDFSELEPLDIYQKLHNETLFHIKTLGSGTYGLTYVSTRYLNKTKKTGTIRSRRRRTYKVKVDTDEKYVIKEESSKSIAKRKDSDPVFEKEARIMTMLKGSDLILDLIAYGEKKDGNQFIITPYEGTDLETACEHQMLPNNKDFLKRFHRFLFRAQEHLMKSGISYLDWKPDNIVWQKKSGVHKFTLIDFGLAQEFDDSEESDVQAGNLMTAAPELFLSFQGFYKVSQANSFSIGATAIVLNQCLKGKTSEIPSLEKNESGNMNEESYLTYLNYIQSVNDVPDYIKDMVMNDPDQRLHYDLKSGQWIKALADQSDYRIFDPDRLEYRVD